MKIKVLPQMLITLFGGFSIVENGNDKIYKESIRFGLYTIKISVQILLMLL